MGRTRWFPLARRIMFGLYWLLGGYRVEGQENVPRRGPLLIACNHVSLADPFAVLAACPRDTWSLAARELYEAPWLGPLIRFLGAIPVRRGEMDIEGLARVRRLLRQGEAVIVYPEGRLSKDGRLLPLFPGVAVLALREGCPVVPAVLWGTQGMLPYGSRWLRPHFKRIRFGPPLRFPPLRRGIPVRQQVDEALVRLRQALLELGAPPGEGDG